MTLNLVHRRCEAPKSFVERGGASRLRRQFLRDSKGILDVHGLTVRETRNQRYESANESWVQRFSYTTPDSLPLAADVSAAGHAYQSYTGAAPS